MKTNTSEDFNPVRIALYKDMKYGHVSVFTYWQEDYEIEGMVRISDPIEVQFKPLSDDAVLHGAIQSLDAEERRARADLEVKLANIRERKSQLLALTHSPEVV